MTLAEKVSSIKTEFVSEYGEPTSRCATGEPYVTLVAGGIKPEGDPYPRWYDSEADAVSEWAQSFDRYAADRNGKRLIWREMPGLKTNDQDKFQVWSRLVIV